MVCPRCGCENPQSFAFCGRCGTRLTGPFHHANDTHLQRAERRQLTVMFCDLVGSTSLSGQLDPEDLNEVTGEYHSVCAELIERHGGRIAQFLGDGLLVYFGYPLSHEDDAQRAVRAGLEIVTAAVATRERLGKGFQVRVAVHTGLVVVGQFGGGTNPDPMAISGEAPNIAARLQTIAEPGAVVISAPTYRLIQGFFRCRSLGTPALKGVVAPMEVFEVVEPTDIKTRFEKAVASGLTPLVGRDQEVELLMRHWEESTHGSGQVVMLGGEPGIGKSRLLRVLKERTGGEWISEFETRCSPYAQNSALYPAIDFLRNDLQFQREDDAETKFVLLEQRLGQWGFTLPDSVPLFAALLSLPPTDRYPPLTMTPQWQKRKTFEAIVAFLLHAARRRPTRVIVEDLHWADPSTLELLELIIEQAPRARLFVALTFRSEFIPPWSAHPHVTSITVGRLACDDVETMIRSVAGGKSLPAAVTNEIATKTDGVPLFVEELTRMVLESGLIREHESIYQRSSPVGTLAIPSTLYDSLMARLDRLGTAKEVAQIAAIIGREFTYELLRAIAPLEEARLTGALNRLVDAELLEEYSPALRIGYRFKHALIRDAAYDSLLRSKRKQLHLQAGVAIETMYVGNLEEHLGELAHHFRMSEDRAKAINYLRLAGQRSLARSANIEAVNHLMRGLELIATLPESPARLQSELAFQTNLGMAWMATKGYAAPETRAAYERARDLCSGAGKSPQLVPIMMGLAIYFMVRAQYRATCDIAEQTLKIAEAVSDSGSAIEAHIRYGYALFYMGEFEHARDHLKRSIELYDPNSHRSHALVFGQEPGMAILSCEACALWVSGYPEKAVALCQRSMHLARESSHAMTLAFASIYASMLHQWLGRDETAAEFAADALRISSEQGLTFWSAVAALCRSAAESRSRPSQDAITAIEDALRSWEATGARAPISYFRFHFAAALARADHTSRAMMLVNQAIAELGDERFYQAELHRLKGELTLQSAHAAASESSEEAEDCFMRALEIARRQKARAFELRATMSLAALWRQTGRSPQAKQLLHEIYSWFTEGFESADLTRAKQLLSELS